METIKTSQLIWFLNMGTMTDYRKCVNECQKNRGNGRPKLAWTQGIAHTVRERELQDEA